MQCLSSILCDNEERSRRVAVTLAGRDYSYGELSDQVDRLEEGLRQNGQGTRTRLAAILPNGLELLILHLAAFRLGLTLVRLNPAYALPQLTYCLRMTQPTSIICEASVAGMLSETDLPSSVQSLWSVGGVSPLARNFEVLLSRPAPAKIDRPVLPDSLPATITFTSGTTARPKGVVHSRAAVGSAIARAGKLFSYTPEDVTVVRIPLYCQVGLLLQSLPALASGGRIELMTAPALEGYLESLARSPSKTILFDTPAVLMQLLRHPRVTSLDFGAVRWLLAGGDFVPHRLRVLARELIGREVSVAYGLTEAGLVACLAKDEGDPTGSSVGYPLPDTELRIVDDSRGDSSGSTAGQILVRSHSAMSGYWLSPELTATVLDSEGWIATGDLGWRSSRGELVLKGRLKDMIVSEGRKISPLEVESALLLHPGLREAGVTGVTDFGEMGEQTQVAAFVVLREGFEPRPSAEDLQVLAASRLADYMVPGRIHFVNRLPLHPTGKLDRGRLRLLAETNDLTELQD